MKKSSMVIAGILSLALTSCGGLVSGQGATGTTSSTGSVLGEILGAATNANTVGNILSSVIGIEKPTQSQIIGTWKYDQPGVAFTSENLLAKAGGEVAASELRNKLKVQYQRFGFTSSNTRLTLNKDNTFTGEVDGKALSGTYTYEPNSCKLTLKTLLFSLPCYVKGSTTGMSFLFESKKLLTLLQTAAALSGNSNIQAIGQISQNYDGIRMGFDMKK